MLRILPILFILPVLVSCGDPRAEAAAEFNTVAARILTRWIELHPERAFDTDGSIAGNFAERYSATGIHRIIEFAHSALDTLATIDAPSLPPDERVDFEILSHAMDAELYELESARTWKRDPAYYDFPFLAMDMITARHVGTHPFRDIEAVLTALPRVLAAARRALDRPTEIATRNAMARMELAAQSLPAVVDTIVANAPAEMRAGLRQAGSRAVIAVTHYGAWLADTLLRRSTTEVRAGRTAFDQRISVLYGIRLTSEELLERAQTEFEETRAQLYDACLAYFRERWPDRAIDESHPNTRRYVVNAALGLIAENRVPADSMIAIARGDIARALAFVTEHGILAPPPGEIVVERMPAYRNSGIPATCEMVRGPEGMHPVVFIAAPSMSWPLWLRTSTARAYNRDAFAELLAHEAVPGHALQQTVALAREAARPVRRVFQSRLFAEGWACYAEGLLARGFGGPEYHIEQIKSRLRILANAILDQKIHAEGMSEQDAVTFLIGECAQDVWEAQVRVRRIVLAPGAMSLFYAGYLELTDLKRRYRASKILPVSDAKFHALLLSHGTVDFRHHARLLGLVKD